jgi:hypothetical protein
MQLAPGAVDTAGNVYVSYPESINDYPDYNGAAIKVVHATRSDLDHWSAPSVVAPPGGAGNVLPHIVAGAPGKVDVAWYHGVAQGTGKKPDWFSYAGQSLDALSAHPHWTTTKLSDVVAEHNQTASDLMGACLQGQEATLNGFYCSRSTDVNGIALDSCGRLLVVWPAQAGLETDATYVSRQTEGPTVSTCKVPPSIPPGSGKPAGNGGIDDGAEPSSDGAVNPASSSGDLADTGSSPAMALAGVVLLAVAGGLAIARRRVVSRR